MKLFKNIVGLFAFIAVCLGIVFFVIYPQLTWLVNGTWIAAILLTLTWLVANRDRVWKFLTKKSTRYGANYVLVVFLVLGIFVFLNVLGKEFNWRKDITRTGVNTLSPQSKKIVKELPEKVKVTFFTRLQDREKAETLLKLYTYEGKNFSYEIVDPNRNPALTKSMGVTKFDTAVMAIDKEGGKRLTIEGATEEKVTNGLVKLLKSKSQTIYFTVGHGEHPLQDGGAPQESYSKLKQELEKEAYVVKELNLFTEGKIPADASAIVIAGPRTALFPKELEIIGEWLKKGGRAIFLMNLDIASGGLFAGTKQVASLLAPYGVSVNDKLLIDPTSKAANVEPQVLMGMAASRDHVIVKDFPYSTMGLVPNFLFPLTTNIKKSSPPEGINIVTLARTTPNAWAETDWANLRKGSVRYDADKDERGELDLAEAIEVKSANVRLAVFGSSAVAMNGYIGFMGNKDLFLNTMAWLTSNDEFISIRAKSENEGDKLELNQNWLNFVFLLVVFVMPISIVAAGVWVWYGRRNK
jgi:ABC-type uncharacterized transport system involved in gliding motility auxiliary subunit